MTALPALQSQADPDDRDLLFDLLLSHKLDHTRDYLKRRRLHHSGTSAKLRERLSGNLDEGQLSRTDLIGLLDDIEGWGNQHIYLYRTTPAACREWRVEATARQALRSCGLEDMLNGQPEILLPETPQLGRIIWTPRSVRFVWAEKRSWHERVPDADMQEDNIEYRAYEAHTTRGVIAFDWDLTTGLAMLLIERLPRRQVYDEHRDRCTKELQAMLPWSAFTAVMLHGAVEHYAEQPDMRTRQVKYETARGYRATYTSPAAEHDVRADPDFEPVVSAGAEHGKPTDLDVYWPADADGANLTAERHVKLYRDDRMAIFGECPESEVRYLVSQICSHC